MRRLEGLDRTFLKKLGLNSRASIANLKGRSSVGAPESKKAPTEGRP
jgi:hypothetical protein